MSEWLRFADGNCVNMDHVTTIRVPAHRAPGDPEQMSLHTVDGYIIELLGPACAAVHAYLDAGVQRTLDIDGHMGARRPRFADEWLDDDEQRGLETKGAGPPPSRPQRRV